MAAPTITINNSTGDAAASGSGTPSTPATGSGASLNGTTSVDLSADSPDLSGVPTDGTAVLYVDTSSGRKFSRITAVDDGTDIVTVATAYDVTESGRNWAIGGVLDDLESYSELFTDWEEEWIVELEATETDYVLTSTISVGGDQTSRLFRSATPASRPVITTATNNTALFSFTTNGQHVQFQYLDMAITASTPGPVVAGGGADSVTFYKCRFAGGSEGIDMDVGSLDYSTLIGCLIEDNDNEGILELDAGSRLIDCVVRNNGGDGILIKVVATIDGIYGCLIVDNGGLGINLQGSTHRKTYRYINNIIANNASHGCVIDSNSEHSLVLHNIFYNNGGYGIYSFDADNRGLFELNAFGSNTSGPVAQEKFEGLNDITLTANPFVDDASGDYTINNAAGGGALLRELGFRFDPAVTEFADYADFPGVIQHEDAGGGGNQAKLRRLKYIGEGVLL